MQKEIKYITKLVINGIIVGIGVSVIVMIIKGLMGGNLTWDYKMMIESVSYTHLDVYKRQVQDELIGKIGTTERDLFEYELQMDLGSVNK